MGPETDVFDFAYQISESFSLSRNHPPILPVPPTVANAGLEDLNRCAVIINRLYSYLYNIICVRCLRADVFDLRLSDIRVISPE